MLIKRLTAAATLAAAVFMATPVYAASVEPAAMLAASNAAAQLLKKLPVFNPAPMLAQSALPADVNALSVPRAEHASHPHGAGKSARLAANNGVDAGQPADQTADVSESDDLGKTLIALAMKLRDIRYVRGGHSPATGFDCSGFVRYVFSHAIGLDLPTNSAGQFLAGLKVKRGDMQRGDLVFFHTGRKSRVSHVGIYIDNGRFIHSPSAGKTVEVSSLDETYWAKRFVGARRPEGIAQNG